MKKLFPIALALAIAVSAIQLPRANASVFVVGVVPMIAMDCNHVDGETTPDAHPKFCKASEIAASVGFFGLFATLFNAYNGAANTIFWVSLPAHQNSIEGTISAALPFLSTSDVYALGSLVHQKMIAGDAETLQSSQLGQGVDIKLSPSEVNSVLDDGDYSPSQRALAADLLG